MRVKSRDSSFIHDSASIMGDLVIWEECPIAAGAVLRGDYGSIRVGSRTSVQKNSVLHARFREACILAVTCRLDTVPLFTIVSERFRGDRTWVPRPVITLP